MERPSREISGDLLAAIDAGLRLALAL